MLFKFSVSLIFFLPVECFDKFLPFSCWESYVSLYSTREASPKKYQRKLMVYFLFWIQSTFLYTQLFTPTNTITCLHDTVILSWRSLWNVIYSLLLLPVMYMVTMSTCVCAKITEHIFQSSRTEKKKIHFTWMNGKIYKKNFILQNFWTRNLRYFLCRHSCQVHLSRKFFNPRNEKR